MKICINCKHYEPLRPGSKMGNRTRWRWVDQVAGADVIPMIGANVERSSALHVVGCNTPDPCGPDGKHWEEAPPKPAPVVKLPWWKRLLSLENAKDESRGGQRPPVGDSQAR